MMNFKAGQEVICIDTSIRQTDKLQYLGFLTIGNFYTIAEINSGSLYIMCDRHFGMYYDAHRFNDITKASCLLYKNLPVGK